MYRPDCPQPAGHLISRVLADAGVYTQLRLPAGRHRVVAVNDCNDDRTYWNKTSRIRRLLNARGLPRCAALPVPFFGGLIGISPYCPGYTRGDAKAFLKQLRFAVTKRGVRLIFGGAHGEECGFCIEYGITVAQRHWLARDAKLVILRTAEVEQWTPSNDPTKVCVTWHRRYRKDGSRREYQKTRAIGVRHSLFEELPVSRVMRLSDRRFIERVSPNLVELIAA